MAAHAPIDGPSRRRPVDCPLCGHLPCEDRGEILHPRPTTVAGVPIDLGDQPFRLMRCPSCSLQFKEPPVDEGALIHCYRQAPAGHWEIQPDARERQFERITSMVDRHAPPALPGSRRRVLDIGCFNGALLQEFGPGWERHGIEPSLDAAALAVKRGVTIHGPTVDASLPGAYLDAALAIDVVEHIPQPRPFFRLVARALRPGGIFVILTGDTDAPSWRWEGSRYWYCSLVEHVSFYCRASLEHAAAVCGMESIDQQRMSHIRAGPARRASETMKNIAYGLVQRIGWLPGRALRARVLHRRAPGWLSARDHLLHVMRRRA